MHSLEESWKWSKTHLLGLWIEHAHPFFLGEIFPCAFHVETRVCFLETRHGHCLGVKRLCELAYIQAGLFLGACRTFF